MDTPETPELSVVLVTPDSFETLRQVITYLDRQTIREKIEIVVAATSRADLALDETALKGFRGHRVVEVGPFDSLNLARAAGIRVATGRIVALTEDHCFPAPTWAEALVKAHEGPWAAVGPVIGLANPLTYRSWANYLLQYGGWVAPTESGVIDDLPGHNSSYKREILMEFEDELEEVFVADSILHWKLRDKGYQLYLAADAKSYHVYMTRLKPYIQENFYIGRQFAATRNREISHARRLLYAVGSPALPLLRGWRILKLVRKHGWVQDLIPGVFPSLALGLLVSAAGEFVGYAFGMGNAAAMTLDLDFRRWRFVSDADRDAIWSGDVLEFRPTARPGELGADRTV